MPRHSAQRFRADSVVSAAVPKGEERERRVLSAREMEERVQERPEMGLLEVLGEDLLKKGRNEEGGLDSPFGVRDEAKRISPICAIVAASSQDVSGVRVAGRSEEVGGGG